MMTAGRTARGGVWLLSLTLIASVALAASAGNDWKARVPQKERSRPNPMAADPSAVAAGGKLFRQNCAKCHGPEGEGNDKHPPVKSVRVQEAAPGELQWLLTNGSMKHGMPSWSRLPEQQRWQIVAYLKALK